MWPNANPQADGGELLRCLMEYGEQQSNPVLALLVGGAVSQRQKYPDQGFNFSDGRWHAFYHCHDLPVDPPGGKEHGHFHIFARPDPSKDAWSHITGLAMDGMGQPIRLFTVNKWVSSGEWLAAADLVRALPCPALQLEAEDETELTRRWLTAMLRLHADNIEALLTERDAILDKEAGGRDLEDILNDRDLYVLSLSLVDLAAKLETALSPKPTPTPNHRGAAP
jgi:hypothetical protein